MLMYIQACSVSALLAFIYHFTCDAICLLLKLHNISTFVSISLLRIGSRRFSDRFMSSYIPKREKQFFFFQNSINHLTRVGEVIQYQELH